MRLLMQGKLADDACRSRPKDKPVKGTFFSRGNGADFRHLQIAARVEVHRVLERRNAILQVHQRPRQTAGIAQTCGQGRSGQCQSERPAG